MIQSPLKYIPSPRKPQAEDAYRVRKGSGPEMTEGIRKLALNLNILQRDTTVRDITRGKCLRPGWDESVLDLSYTESGSIRRIWHDH